MTVCVWVGQSAHRSIILSKPVRKRQSKEEREQRDILLPSMHVLVSVYYYPLLFIVRLHHSKQSCSTEGTDARRTVVNGI